MSAQLQRLDRITKIGYTCKCMVSMLSTGSDSKTKVVYLLEQIPCANPEGEGTGGPDPRPPPPEKLQKYRVSKQ